MPNSYSAERWLVGFPTSHACFPEKAWSTGLLSWGLSFRWGKWWAVRDSNPRHPACKAGVLTNRNEKEQYHDGITRQHSPQT